MNYMLVNTRKTALYNAHALWIYLCTGRETGTRNVEGQDCAWREKSRTPDEDDDGEVHQESHEVAGRRRALPRRDPQHRGTDLPLPEGGAPAVRVFHLLEEEDYRNRARPVQPAVDGPYRRGAHYPVL